MAGLNWQCCCDGQLTCPDSCNFEDQYTVLNLGFTVSHSHIVQNNIISQACCFDVVSHDFTATGVPLQQVIAFRCPAGKNPTPPCCYIAEFDMRISGTFHRWWDFDIQSGPPIFPNCQSDETYNFQEDVPCRLEICCVGDKWQFQLHVCHFQITCNDEYNYQDCEGSYEPIGQCNQIPAGIRCAGGTFTWFSPLNDLSVLGNTHYNFGVCNCYNQCCLCVSPSAGQLQYCNISVANGSGAWFGLFGTDECSGQDPYLPCDPAHGNLNFLLYPSVPYSSSGYWCSNNMDEEQVGCSLNSRFWTVNPGTYV